MITELSSLTPEQEHAVTMMLARHNVFATGSAGTGKSVCLRSYRQLAGNRVAFLAPTGIAALNIGGSTLHRFFGLRPDVLPPDEADCMTADVYERLQVTDTIVIDEISMVRSDVFCTIDALCRKAAPMHHRDRAFGGKQIIVVGDFFQLPPVVKSYWDEQYLLQNYRGVQSFQTCAWAEANFEDVVLSEVHRQAADPAYVNLLNQLRGAVHLNAFEIEYWIDKFNSMIPIGTPPDDGTTLCLTRNKAAAINTIKDDRIPGMPVTFQAELWGYIEELPAEVNLHLKIGSRVMVLCNEYGTDGSLLYANGETGHVTLISASDHKVNVTLDSGREVEIGPHEWRNVIYDSVIDPITGEPALVQKVIGRFRQIPLKLAYAITVHKAQGTTLEGRVHVELERGTFAPGQHYTALSRCRSPQQLSISRPLHISDVRVDVDAREFYSQVEVNAGDAFTRFTGGVQWS